MDDIRGRFSDHSEPFEDDDYLDLENDDETGTEPPPAAIGSDERRMQVRAYNYWASMLGERNFPAIEDLDPQDESDFGPYSVLLDFTGGIENPAIAYLGEKLADECGLEGEISHLGDVPSRSLLSRITDHYLQIIANQAPIGFEAEFVNQRGVTILYRGILLPYSSDDDTIDFIYGVINWKELADQKTTDDLMLQIDQALEPKKPDQREDTPLSDWADGPSADIDADMSAGEDAASDGEEDEDVLDLGVAGRLADEPQDFPEPQLSAKDALARLRSSLDNEETGRIDFANPNSVLRPQLDDDSDYEDEEEDYEDDGAADGYADLSALGPSNRVRHEPLPALDAYSPEVQETDLPESAERDPAEMGLYDWLASARDLAEQAKSSEERTRKALYEAIGRAYDFSLAAHEQPDEYAALLEDAGLSVQDRAPMTPIVKLVFGTDYDKTRLTEYASALTYAHDRQLGRGELADLLANAPGGLKGIVAEERRRRREESGEVVEPRDEVRAALAGKLRKLDPCTLEDIPEEGGEFTVLVARRMPDGEIVLLGEVADDVPLIERAARKLLG